MASEHGLPDNPVFFNHIFYVTAVRHPLDREYSEWERLQRVLEFKNKARAEGRFPRAQNLSIYKDYQQEHNQSFPEHLRDVRDNYLVRRFAGSHTRTAAAAMTSVDLDAALINLRKFDFVMMTESLDKDLQLLGKFLHPRRHFPARKRNRNDKDSLPARKRFADDNLVLELFHMKWALDLVFFEQASTVHARHVNVQGNQPDKATRSRPSRAARCS